MMMFEHVRCGKCPLLPYGAKLGSGRRRVRALLDVCRDADLAFTRAPVDHEIDSEGLKLVEPGTGMALVWMPRPALRRTPRLNRIALCSDEPVWQRLRREFTDGLAQWSGRRTK